MAKTLLAALATVACLAGAMPALAETIVFGITSTTALSLPHYIAEDRKFYDAEHPAVETYAVGTAASVLQQQAALYLDGIRANLDAFVAMGEIAQAPALTGFIDASFLAEALAPGRPGRGPAR